MRHFNFVVKTTYTNLMVIDGSWRGVLLLQQFFNKENDNFKEKTEFVVTFAGFNTLYR